MAEQLFLHQEALLLLLEDKRGTTHAALRSDPWQLVVALGLYAELVLHQRIEARAEELSTMGTIARRFTSGHGDYVVRAISEAPLGDELLDDCLQRVVASKKELWAVDWVNSFRGTKKLKDRTAAVLVDRGNLRAESRRVFPFGRRSVYLPEDPATERVLVGRLREAIFDDTSEPDERTSVLVAVLYCTADLGRVYGKKEIQARQDRIEKVVIGRSDLAVSIGRITNNWRADA